MGQKPGTLGILISPTITIWLMDGYSQKNMVVLPQPHIIFPGLQRRPMQTVRIQVLDPDLDPQRTPSQLSPLCPVWI